MGQESLVLSEQEALEKILGGDPIQGCFIEKLDLSNQEIVKPIVISECRIGNLVLSATKIRATVTFQKTVFQGDVIGGWENFAQKVGSVVFEEGVSWKECVFQGKVLLSGAQFLGVAAFQNAVFQKSVHFRQTSFREQAYFWKAQFSDVANFHGAHFGVEGHFDQCEFFRNAFFDNAKFLQKEASFNAIHAHENMSFLDASFEGYFAARKAIFDGEADFKNAQFQEIADFTDVRFLKKVSFRNARFQKDAMFFYTVFEGLASFLGTKFVDATFLNAQFHDEILLNYDRNTRESYIANVKREAEEAAKATDKIEPEAVAKAIANAVAEAEAKVEAAASFAGLAKFTNAHFHKRAVFEEVDFAKTATFTNAYFGEQANFRDAFFHGPVSFNGAYCNQELTALRATFSGEVTFDYANINRRLDLSEAKIGAISFYKASIDLIVIEIAQVRKKLLNESPTHLQYDSLKEESPYHRVKEEYLLLKESFQKRGLATEEDWAYRKFRQMKRKAGSQKAFARILGKSKEGGFLGSAFRLLQNFLERISLDRGTGYGTQPLNIAIVAFAIIALFSFVYSTFPEELIIQQRLPFGFSQALYFSFSTFTTMGVGDIQPRLDSFMQYVICAEAFLGLFIMTLFVGTYTRKIIR